MSPVFAAGGIVFALTSLNLLVFSSLPLQLGDVFWQLRLIGGVITNGLNLLIGAMLICLASIFARPDQSIKNLAKLCRKISFYLAVFYLLMIPIQAYLGFKAQKIQSAAIEATIAPLPKLIRSIKAARSPDELNGVLLSLPEPQALAAKLPDTFDNVKANIAATFQAKYNAAQEKSERFKSERLQTLIGEFFRNSIQSLVLFFGFASVGQLSPSSPSLAQRIFGDSRSGSPDLNLGVDED
jgi:hypothetical protein